VLQSVHQVRPIREDVIGSGPQLIPTRTLPNQDREPTQDVSVNAMFAGSFSPVVELLNVAVR
jgi:hypothetical protein